MFVVVSHCALRSVQVVLGAVACSVSDLLVLASSGSASWVLPFGLERTDHSFAGSSSLSQSGWRPLDLQAFLASSFHHSWGRTADPCLAAIGSGP